MKSLKLLSFLLLPLILPLTSNVWAQAKNNQQLTDDIARVQQDMQRLQRLLDNRAMLELFQRMDDLAEEVSQLRGQLEQHSHDLAGIKKRQRDLYLDIDRRLRELEITSTRPAANASAPTSAAPANPVMVPSVNTTSGAGPMLDKPEPRSPVTAKPPMVTKPATINNSKKPRVPVSDERAAYQKAFDMLKEGRYKMANTGFKTFLKRYPKSGYASNAQYWLGESNYVTRKFEQAVKEFNRVLKQYPSSNKVPDAMLKLGYTYYELAQFDQARQMLQQLRKLSPNSTAARLAGKRLERMKREGR